jgi:hypothetical protein
MRKFHALSTSKLSIVDLAGLSQETIIAGNAASASLGALGTTALNALVTADTAFRTKLISAQGSQLTEQIKEADERRDESFREIRRIATAASKSSIPANAAAGQALVTFLNPYSYADKEPMMSETSTINFLQTQFNADATLQNAAMTLQLLPVFANLFTANEQVSTLWNARALEDAQKSGPSPSSLRNDLEKSYRSFCDVIVQTLWLQPSEPLENLFLVMNEIRIKYSKFLPTKLTESNTSVDPLPIQLYTGKAITPIPRVFVKKSDDETVELLFSVDFEVTYRNNIEVGEAKIIVHGKGKFHGSYSSTFHIAKEV